MRKTRPELKATSDLSPQGRERLALFCALVLEGADAAVGILREHGGDCAQMQSAAQKATNDKSFHGQLLRATSQLIRHEDDLETQPDPATAQAMQQALARERGLNDCDRRLLRLATYVGEVAAYQSAPSTAAA